MIFGVVRDPLEWERWAEARALLGAEAEGLREALLTDHAQLWVAIDGDLRCALITELLDVDGRRECFLRLVGGEGRGEWLHYLDNEITDWARNQGCTAMEGTMRPGWERVFKDWKKTAVVLRREI